MSSAILEEIKHYWTNRAEGYSKVNQDELAGKQKIMWLKEIKNAIESIYRNHNPKDIHILDVGTGPGFFAIILAEAGYQVTAVDYTSAMIEQAKKNSGEFVEKIHFVQMDGQNLTFKENSFDVVVSRNLTWGLENPQKAYTSWRSVLKQGGLLLNFDANWYGYLYDEKKKKAYEHDRYMVSKMGVEDHYTCTDINAMEKIAIKVPLSKLLRPQWDIEKLKELEMVEIEVDELIGESVLSQTEKINYASTPLFMIKAVK
jgi:ubiquinone/menaquinone biosynthesis C-methylase UbiE